MYRYAKVALSLADTVCAFAIITLGYPLMQLDDPVIGVASLLIACMLIGFNGCRWHLGQELREMIFVALACALVLLAHVLSATTSIDQGNNLTHIYEEADGGSHLSNLVIMLYAVAFLQASKAILCFFFGGTTETSESTDDHHSPLVNRQAIRHLLVVFGFIPERLLVFCRTRRPT